MNIFVADWNYMKSTESMWEAIIEMSIELMNCYDNKYDFNLRLMCSDWIGFYTRYAQTSTTGLISRLYVCVYKT